MLSQWKKFVMQFLRIIPLCESAPSKSGYFFNGLDWLFQLIANVHLLRAFVDLLVWFTRCFGCFACFCLLLFDLHTATRCGNIFG
jgi:hypothetical protein